VPELPIITGSGKAHLRSYRLVDLRLASGNLTDTVARTPQRSSFGITAGRARSTTKGLLGGTYHLLSATALADVVGTFDGRAIEYQSRSETCYLLRHGRDGRADGRMRDSKDEVQGEFPTPSPFWTC
jgi:hypothetical protein